MNCNLCIQKLFVALAVSASAWGAEVPRPARAISPSPRQHAPIIIHERHGGMVTSDNWSGYAVTGASGSINDVKGSWVVPAIQAGSCGSSASYSSFWVGIDGYDSNTVEQIGTDSDCHNGAPVYYAWFEFYPHLSYTINSVPIHPGDTISAEVNYSDGIFTVTLTDSTTGGTFSTSTKMNQAKRSSAEWIAEAPSGGGIAPLAHFVPVDFGAGYTGVSSTCTATTTGASGPIGLFPAANLFQITMVDKSGNTEAQPSPLSSQGSSFSVSWVSGS